VSASENIVPSSGEMMRSVFHSSLHEIGTPLNAVVSASRLLKTEMENGNTEVARELLKMIFSSADYLSEIFERVRQVTRQENMPAFQLDETIFDFRDWADNLLHSMAALFMEKEISVKKVVADDFPLTVYCDRVYLTQVMYNILINALKYSPAFSSVSITCFIENNESFCIEITDQGIGIPSARLPFIFKEYYQVAPDDQSRFGGMGLGLSIAGALTRLMGGSIYVMSESGAGSTFTVMLPLKKFKLSFI
jgi:signal transduction histidine kinase